MPTQSLFVELSIVIVAATLIAGLMRLLKQPLIMGHILTGIIIGSRFIGFLDDRQTFEVFSQFGISILLFIVGLSLSPKAMREVGRASFLLGACQITVTTLLGFFLAKILGYNFVSALYISIALTFSSTIIILKMLSDKKDIEKLHGRLAVGMLLVQDVCATILLIFVSAFSKGGNIFSVAFLTLLKGVVLTLILFYISKNVLPKLSSFFASSTEYLFLFSMAWGFGMASLFWLAGFSLEIGALIAGATLSVSPYAQEIGAKLKPLRDFFVIMFFISLGSNMGFGNISHILIPALIFSLFVLIFDPLIVMIILGILGYNRRIGFLTGLTVAQISEFSLILVLLGVKVGHIQNDVLSVVTVVGVITIAVSTYLMLYGDKLYPCLSKYLVIFEKRKPLEDYEFIGNYDVILFGCNRVGYDFIRIFKHLGQGFLAIDFDPDVVKSLSSRGINARYGDAEDMEFLNDINVGGARMVISTIPDFDANLFLLTQVRKANEDAIVILISYNLDEALALYHNDATYVIMPHFISGQFASELAHKSGFDVKTLHDKREEHIDYLKERKKLGHLHPRHRDKY